MCFRKGKTGSVVKILRGAVRPGAGRRWIAGPPGAWQPWPYFCFALAAYPADSKPDGRNGPRWPQEHLGCPFDPSQHRRRDRPLPEDRQTLGRPPSGLPGLDGRYREGDWPEPHGGPPPKTRRMAGHAPRPARHSDATPSAFYRPCCRAATGRNEAERQAGRENCTIMSVCGRVHTFCTHLKVF